MPRAAQKRRRETRALSSLGQALPGDAKPVIADRFASAMLRTGPRTPTANRHDNSG